MRVHFSRTLQRLSDWHSLIKHS
ncbi:hypothetical protein CBM2623_B170446 [Cupriavidus taiwanensis]|nr:hypothetical protein CBM2608_B140514 [Cupriavidus taiwanensis]SPA33402.1 hypothetical protein CBM2623_B170446 [Cupriavidus taiwanensis]SPA49055.1 hypothetical protein CBM2629_B10378 [Cupriavidus taiwanensis]